MAQDVFVVAQEGDDLSVALFAAEHAKREGASILLVHVLEWSPYSFLTPQELEERHKRRKEEMARAEQAVLGPALERVRALGVEAEGETRYGSVVEMVLRVAKERKAAMIFVGRTGASGVAARVFGSVSLGLAQTSPIPTVIVP